jgi:hypothetical protein
MEEVLALAGHLPQIDTTPASTWPEFREYAVQKYPGELDEDVIGMIEDLIERRRDRRRSGNSAQPAELTASGS